MRWKDVQPRGGHKIYIIGLCLLFSVAFLPADLIGQGKRSGEALEPQLMSKSAVLYDLETGTLLFSKAPDISIPPASMTKLMTLHLVYKAFDEGRITPDTIVTIDENEDFRNLPRRSSLMFLEAGQHVSVRELMRGLAVPSGNDAALVLARLVSDTVETFVEEMNREVNALGLQGIHFSDPAGLSEDNKVTAREFGKFCMHYIRSHPDSLEDLHNLESFTYPSEEAAENGEPVSFGPVTQNNYNVLIGRHPWVDGLKTGYIDESGYNIALTARADGRRLVAVLLGGPGESPMEGSLTRAIDGVNLISYGFYAYRRVMPAIEPIGPLRVWKGDVSHVDITVPPMAPLILPAEDAGSVQYRYDIDLPLIAPLSAEEEIGEVVIVNGEEVLAKYPLFPGMNVEAGGWLRRLIDAVRLFFQEIFI